MSIPLPQVNLANVSVGTTGTISLNTLGISAGGVSADPSLQQYAGTLHIQNESGSGLLMSFLTSGDSFYLPAGAWTDRPIRPGESSLKYTVLYNLPSPPVTLLLITYYAPNEKIPSNPTLGNSPIGIGGNVSTVGTATLSNEGNSSQTLIIDIGEVGHTLLFTLNSDGSCIWSVLQSSVAHQIFKSQISGNPLQLGQAGDITEVLGKLTVDQTTILTQAVTLLAGVVSTGTTGGAIDLWDTGGVLGLGRLAQRDILDAAGLNTFFKGATSIQLQVPNGTTIVTINSNGLQSSASGTGIKGSTGQYIKAISGFGVGSGATVTVNHNLGTTPSGAVVTQQTVAGSQTQGVSSITSTQLTVTNGNSAAAWGIAFLGA